MRALRTWSISGAILLFAAVVSAGPPKVPGAVRGVIKQWLEMQWGKGQVEFEIATRPRTLPSRENYQVRVEGDERPRGLSILYLKISESGKRDRRIPLSVRVHPTALVPVAKRTLKRGETLRNEMIVWKRRDVSDVRDNWPENTPGLTDGSNWLRRTVRENDVLTNEAVEKRPEVLIGEPVVLVAQQGSVSIETTGVAMESGRIGDWIKVENSQYKSILRAQVADKAKAVVGGLATRGIR